jgi:cyclopropane-fatty-acyl-phospholipid synthase
MTTALAPAVFTSTKGQTGLPRYFAAVFDRAETLERGRLDFRLPDGRFAMPIWKAGGPRLTCKVFST